MKLLFLHGWGFDAGIWAALRARLPEWEHLVDDRGYFGEAQCPQATGPCLAITHSLGTMRVMAAPPQGLAGIIAINGFARFAEGPGRPGVPLRVIDRMIRRFDEEPYGVVTAFREQVLCTLPYDEIDPVPLREDLLILRDGQPPLPQVPILTLQGGDDPLMPRAMRDTVFERTHAQRIDVPGAGHLLPLEAPDLCAQAIRGALAALQG